MATARVVAIAFCAVLAAHLAAATGDSWYLAQAPAGPGTPRRIVSLVPAATEMLFAIGAESQIVGVSSYDRFPPQVGRLPKVGGLLDPNVERLLSLRPDLVVVYGTQTDLRQLLDRAGISVFVYSHRDLADVTRTLRELGDRVGAATRAHAEAARIEGALADIGRQASRQGRPKALLVIGHEAGTLRQVQASGGYGFLHDLLVIAGAHDVLADLQRESVAMSTEMLLTRAPDVIIDLHSGNPWPPDRVAAERGIWRTLASVPAIKSDRVRVLVGDEFVVPGPRVVAAARQLASALHAAPGRR